MLFFSVALILLGVKIELNWFAYCTRIHYLSQKFQNELFCTQCEYSFDIQYSTDWGTRDILGFFFCAKGYDCKFDLCFATRFMYNKSPAFLRYNTEAFFFHFNISPNFGSFSSMPKNHLYHIHFSRLRSLFSSAM